MAAIFPVPKIPTVVILRNGELKEYLPAGTSKEDFSRRVLSALGAPAPAPQVQPPATSAQAQQLPSDVNPSNAASPTAATTGSPSPAAQSPAPVPASSVTESTSVQADTAAPTQDTADAGSRSAQAMMAERAAKLNQEREEAKKRAAEIYAKNKAKGNDKTDPGSDDKDDPKRPPRNDFADSVRRKQREAKEERKRILKQIEDNRMERREAASTQPHKDASTATSSGPSTSSKRASENAAIMVRLYDGSTLRSRFAKGSSLRGDIRKWVDSNRNDGSTSPYKFRVALNPSASRLIDDTEEDRTLEELGLAPSATLVLVPVPNFVTAGSGGGILQRTSTFFVWFYTMVTTFFSSLLGGRPASRPEEIEMDELNAQDRQESQRGKSSGSRVNTLQDPARQRRDHQLYNGNSVGASAKLINTCVLTIRQLNFEPRPEDDGEP